MTQKAIVISTDEKFATVSVMKKSACASCSGRHVCISSKPVTTQAKNFANAKVGDSVEIYAPDNHVLAYSALVFLAPVALSFILYFSISQINQIAAIIFGIIGFALPLVIGAITGSKLKEKLLPEIVAICPEEENYRLLRRKQPG